LSWLAFATAAALLITATLLREGFAHFGASISFATFYPAILAAALVCGPFAASAALPAALLIVWWAFWSPQFQFWPLTATEISNSALFILSGSLVVYLGHCCRVLIREQDDKDRQRDLLVRELDHRGRNTFMVLDSITRATLKERPDLAEKLAGRIRALSRANDIVYHSETPRVSLRRLVDMKIRNYDSERISLAGDGTELDSNSGRALTLVLHELLTNAHKYGALKSATGRLAIRWTARSDRVEVEWIESGAAEPVRAPEKFGFGTRLIDTMLHDIGAEIQRTFEPDGLRCLITFASSDVVPTGCGRLGSTGSTPGRAQWLVEQAAPISPPTVPTTSIGQQDAIQTR
jgi:two-component sensor histidine kinase